MGNSHKLTYLRGSLINPRSLCKHAQHINDLILSDNLDCLFITETWLKSWCNPDIVCALPTDYLIHRQDRPEQRGGGLASIYRSSLKYSVFEISDLRGAESIGFCFQLEDSFAFSGALVYRPPGPNNIFLESLGDIVSTLALKFANFTLLGDFKIHLDIQSDLGATQFRETMATLGLKQHILTPTHNAGHTLDGICSNLTTLTVKDPVSFTWSDHKLIHLEIRCEHMTKHIGHISTNQSSKPRWKDMAAHPDLNLVASGCKPRLLGDPTEDKKRFTIWITTLKDRFAFPGPVNNRVLKKPWPHGIPKI